MKERCPDKSCRVCNEPDYPQDRVVIKMKDKEGKEVYLHLKKRTYQVLYADQQEGTDNP